MTEAPVALITGATRGIGLATACLLARRGHAVVLTGRRAGPALDQAAATVSELAASPPLALELDVSDPDQVAAAYRSVFLHHRRLDVLVNNAGVMERGLLGMISADSIDRTLAVNTAGTLYNLQAATRLMSRRGAGCIINISSAVGLQGAAGNVAYAASKAAIVGLTRAAARELGCKGIRVNAVAPGFIDTDMTAALPADQRQRTIDAIALGRAGSPDDVAEVIAFLASPAAAYLTGQVIGIDGGLVLPL